MTPNGFLQIAVFFVVILALTKPMGAYMTKVFAGERTFLHPVRGEPACVQHIQLPDSVRDAAAPGSLAVQSHGIQHRSRA
jgi:hypothetical protein